MQASKQLHTSFHPLPCMSAAVTATEARHFMIILLFLWDTHNVPKQNCARGSENRQFQRSLASHTADTHNLGKARLHPKQHLSSLSRLIKTPWNVGSQRNTLTHFTTCTTAVLTALICHMASEVSAARRTCGSKGGSAQICFVFFLNPLREGPQGTARRTDKHLEILLGNALERRTVWLTSWSTLIWPTVKYWTNSTVAW